MRPRLARLLESFKRVELATRPVHPDLEAALRRRWAELPDHVKTPNQMLGRRTNGCEGTHGVFPRCNLACTPCYHAKEAQQVRTDGAHTVREVDRQMAYLRKQRGPGQYSQLIGGEVTLLEPADHAAALEAMRKHGRKPMSLSHGDFDYEYLRDLAIAPDGTPRFPELNFAGHFDSLMFGRRGIKKPPSEKALNPYRKRFCELFQRLEAEHGVKHYLAHNMTVTPANIDAIPDLLRDCRDYGFRMFSFQPAAFIGNTKRWKHDYREYTTDKVWEKIEEGAGTRIPFRIMQIGDERCNRTGYGAWVGERWIPLLDDRVPADHRARDQFIETFGGMDFINPPLVTLAKLARAFAGNPRAIPVFLGVGVRFVRRAGGVRAVMRNPPRAQTFVMHSFMDARLVKPAWAALQRGEVADDPEVRATQERLRACSYAMAHPDDDRLVPACAQHGVYDPLENLVLRDLLPVTRSSAPVA